MKIPFTWIIIAALIVVILLQRACVKGGGELTPPKIDTIWRTVRDTVKQKIPVPYEVVKEGKPYPVEVVDTEFLTVRQNVDTAAILRDYFVTRFYIDTAKLKYGTLFIRDSVTQNKIKFRQIVADWSIPTVSAVQTAPPRNQVYVGLDLGSNGTSTIGFGPMALLKTKLDHIYGLGASYIPGTGMYFHGSLFYKITLSKPKIF